MEIETHFVNNLLLCEKVCSQHKFIGDNLFTSFQLNWKLFAHLKAYYVHISTYICQIFL